MIIKTTLPPLGSHYVLEGFRLINQKGLRRFVILPVLFNIILFTLFWYVGFHFFTAFLHWLDGLLPHWLQWLHWLLWPLFVFSCVIIFAYTFTFVTLLLAAPFNGLLAEKVEALLSGEIIPSPTLWALLKDMPRIVKREIQKLWYYLPRALGLFILFFIPLIQLAAPLVWFLFTAWSMAMLYVDYPMDNHRLPFKTLCQQMRSQPFLYLSFGAMIALFTVIPFLNLVIMPAAVAGATKLYVEQIRDRPHYRR
ncbi:MAG: sulfate transporter CysZ [Gammaproteobacteria bacterium]|jgi:CysZ protein|nr:sulfate transporter CysZ [Gammaproteobacteria bacterium]